MATRGNQPKTISSRLAGMKFMQRAGESPGPSPTASNAIGERPTKKQRLSNGLAQSGSSTPVDRATATDEQKLAEAVERGAFDRDESKWYLSFKPPQAPAMESPLRIVSAGFSSLDNAKSVDISESDDEEEEEEEVQLDRPSMPGRRSFGKFNKKLEKASNGENSYVESSSDEDEGDEEDDGDIEEDPTGVNALIAQGKKEAAERVRAERKAQKKAEQAESQRLARDRHRKGVNLNKVTSISNGGGISSGGGGRSAPSASNIICHNCS